MTLLFSKKSYQEFNIIILNIWAISKLGKESFESLHALQGLDPKSLLGIVLSCVKFCLIVYNGLDNAGYVGTKTTFVLRLFWMEQDNFDVVCLFGATVVLVVGDTGLK